MEEKELIGRVDAFIDAHRQDIIDDIAALVAVDSVKGQPAPGAPFGPGPLRALQVTGDIAARLGLPYTLAEGYIGWAQLAGEESEKYLATICHVDVVPAGNGWDADPFTLRRQEGWLLGRGAADDKGPMVITLYALACLRQLGVKLRYPIRALAGANEETGMQDVQWYLAHQPAPAFCFTPDAEFPVCNGEKGHFGGTLSAPLQPQSAIVEMSGGVADNAVPDRAFALVRADLAALSPREGITLEDAGEGLVKVRGWGRAGHAAMPQGTCNAIGLVVDYLLDNHIGSGAERAYLSALHRLHMATDGSGLGIAASDGPFGPLTIIGGRIFCRDGHLVQTFDSRYPTTAQPQKMLAAIRAAVGEGVQVDITSDARPFYIEADSPAIRACIDTFNEVTGQHAVPFTMGGGTYARHFPYAVSFGPEHADTVLPAFGGPMHGPNEAAPLDKLLEALKIYVLALLRLEQLDL